MDSSRNIGRDERPDLASPGLHTSKGFSGQVEDIISNVPGSMKPEADLVSTVKLTEGETVVSLCPDNELDVGQMSKKVGLLGQVVAIIPARGMPEGTQVPQKVDAANVRYVTSSLIALEVGECSADVVLGARLLPMVPNNETQRVFDSVYRVLKSGGRFAMSECLLRKEMPESVRKMVPPQASQLGNAVQISKYEAYLKTAGFEDINIMDTKRGVKDLDAHAEGGASGSSPKTGHSAAEPATGGSGAYESPPVPRKEDDRSGGGVRRKVGKFTRSLVPGMDEKDDKSASYQEVDFNEFAGCFYIVAKKPIE